MHTQHYDYTNIGCGCESGHFNQKTCESCYSKHTSVLYPKKHKNRPKNGCGCVDECPTHHLTATSTPLETTEIINLCDHSCVEHNWNFECNLKDSCCRQNGSNDNGAVSFSNLDSTVKTGVKNLGRYLIVAAGNDGPAVRIGNFNVNPVGLAVSLWVRTSDINQANARLFSKTGATPGDNEGVQSHVISAQIVSGGGLTFRLKLGKDPTTGTTEWTVAGVLKADTWHHLVFWYDGCNVKIFVDAVEQTTITETGAGTPFSTVKGQTVFQGDQPVALASQPSINTGGSWFRFAGNMDQVIVWNYAIAPEIITALYGTGNGATSVPEVNNVSSAKFGCGCNKVQLRHWTTNLCLETCFVDADLCTLFDQCGTVGLLVTNCGKCRTVIVPATNLNGWPGSLETLESKLIDGGAKRSYTLRLSLSLNSCPVYLNAHDQVDFVINRGNFIKTPAPNFVITGK